MRERSQDDNTWLHRAESVPERPGQSLKAELSHLLLTLREWVREDRTPHMHHQTPYFLSKSNIAYWNPTGSLWQPCSHQGHSWAPLLSSAGHPHTKAAPAHDYAYPEHCHCAWQPQLVFLILINQVFTKTRPSSLAALGGRNDPSQMTALASGTDCALASTSMQQTRRICSPK